MSEEKYYERDPEALPEGEYLDGWDSIPDDEGQQEVWTNINIWTFGPEPRTLYSSCYVDWATNDDNDDGYPDGEIVRARYDFSNVWEALVFFHGGTHQGVLCPVIVHLDGNTIYTEGGAYREERYKPYCLWPREEYRR